MADKSEMAFSFASQAKTFEEHILKSIRGYDNLRNDCIALSKYFVENDTSVRDLGCSTRKFLSELLAHNNDRAPRVRYIGIDIEPAFENYWQGFKASNLAFHTCDIRSFKDYERLSFVTSLFSL